MANVETGANDDVSSSSPPYNMIPALTLFKWIQGSPTDLVRPYRLCLLFQANCPGCHTHAIPTANQIFLEQLTTNSDETLLFDVYGLSTAFEDFEYNTVESTRLLVEEGRRVGVVKRHLGELVSTADDQASSSSSMIPKMPVAFDILTSKKDASPEFLEQAIQATLHNAHEHVKSLQLPPVVAAQLLGQLTADKVKETLPDVLASVFYTVAAQGTPTWILYAADDGRVLDRLFGQYSAQDLMTWADKTIAQDKKNAAGKE